MPAINNERGVVLITVLLLMAIVALLGTLALNGANVDIQISGFMRRVAAAFGGAEGGTDLAVPVIEETISAGVVVPAPGEIAGLTIDTAGDLAAEITGGLDFDNDEAADAPDLVMTVNNVELDVDIDRMYSYALPGGATEFAAGYEGVGNAAAGGGTGVLYKVTGEGTR